MTDRWLKYNQSLAHYDDMKGEEYIEREKEVLQNEWSQKEGHISSTAVARVLASNSPIDCSPIQFTLKKRVCLKVDRYMKS